ncbi:GyrI-like domain-containing protein [Paenibacillus sp. HN-1]|uniref:AraC family transcriptional regulator n=1 Tax=Paenibacillus TaxID=44249 RepID=UPI001CA9C383|nr:MULTISPECIES: GyrI-like domain-containing protein [Paenibacillus]MBY9080807.1 GyrI-like domain-containing protein [Paenibacillus sp. CGMCC 1.18879]MBY9085201.1 GyrI-like domain-containing protein [Paenibacillus sinensis]
MNLKVEPLPPCRIAYVRQTGPYGSANAVAMEKVKEWARGQQLLDGSAVLFGIPQDNPQTTPPEQCRYDACIVIPEDYAIADSAGDASIHEDHFSGGKYAVCVISHTAEAIGQAWTEIFKSLHTSGLQLDYNKPIIERYKGELLEDGWCEICVPVL